MADKANKYELHARNTTYVAGAGIAYDATQPNGSAHVGKLLKHSGDDTVDLPGDAEEVMGKLLKVEPDGFCSVQDFGYADVPTAGTITYTQANNGCVGSATPGSGKVATVVPAAGAVRGAKFIKSDGANKAIVKFM